MKGFFSAPPLVKIKTIAAILSDMVALNKVGAKPYTDDGFRGEKLPTITIEKYLERFGTHLVGDESGLFVCLMVYLERFLLQNEDHSINEYNVHRLIICSLLLAYKQHIDECVGNKHIAKVAGVGIEELNRLEVHFLMQLDFKTHVSEKEFDDCYEVLEADSIEYAKRFGMTG